MSEGLMPSPGQLVLSPLRNTPGFTHVFRQLVFLPQETEGLASMQGTAVAPS
jgi:hypothetical protein